MLVKNLVSAYNRCDSVYKLSPPITTTIFDVDGNDMLLVVEYVVVTGNTLHYTGPETYILPSTAEGKITSWMELRGSFQGRIDHKEALRRAGYTLVS